MNDARLQEWLELSRAALAAADADFIAGSAELVARRAALMQSLCAVPASVSDALAEELRQSESAVQGRFRTLLDGLRDRLLATREGRAAARSYQPEPPSVAAFVSKDV